MTEKILQIMPAGDMWAKYHDTEKEGTFMFLKVVCYALIEDSKYPNEPYISPMIMTHGDGIISAPTLNESNFIQFVYDKEGFGMDC